MFRSFVALALSIVPAALAVNVQLDQYKFDNLVKTGTWLIEFYSPSCHFCKEFAPTWEQLVDVHDGLAASHNIHFGNVNCLVRGDLCKEQNLPGYPTLRLYHNGKMAEIYAGDRSFDDVTDFIMTEHKRLTKPKKKQQKPAPEDDVATHGRPNPQGISAVLDGPSLDTAISNGDPYFVKFFVPWCPHCKHLEPTWNQMALQLRSKVNVGQINCDNHRDVCQTHGVRGYPTLMMFSGGNVRDFPGGDRSLPNLLNFAMTASKPTVKNVDLATLDQNLDPNGVSLLFLHKNEKDNFHEVLEELAERFANDVTFYSTTDEQLMLRYGFDRNGVPRALILKNGRGYVFFSVFLASRADGETLASWIDNERYPMVAEVSPLNAEGLLRGDRVVVLGAFSQEDEESYSKLKQIAQERADADARSKAHADRTVFAHINTDLYGDYLSQGFGIKKKNVPVVVIIDGRRKQFFVKNLEDKALSLDDHEALLATLDSALEMHIKGTSALSYQAQLTQQLRSGYQQATMPYVFLICLGAITGYTGIRYIIRRRSHRPVLPTSHQD
ncbi:thioredoxin-like protein [Hesseltinella vesiculosa]|uniref:Thioredoxin-like protein n=1 Tax=Hesseltinella vesiculosa TaxID=101127 RepID=A0A1X2GPY2_9FUNG|nr:thioredoxin-like protein [Hesseltinella vesiculosa]